MRFAPDPGSAELLVAHDRLLRGDPEVIGADDLVVEEGLWLAVFGEDGFVTHRALGELTIAALDTLVSRVIAHFGARSVSQFEWKTRSHDVGNDSLVAALLRADLAPEPVETVMIGETAKLMTPVAVPESLVLRKAGTGGHDLSDDVEAVDALHAAVFEHHQSRFSERLMAELTERPDLRELWLVSDGVQAISAGRVEFSGPVAGLFGGATLPQWRGRGLYRAMTASRAASAARAGCELMYAECTPFSEPILRSAGLRAITTTTPYLWRRPGA
ncbi:MAG TPA: hypothetical protein PKD84_07740 [Propionicimonas sp.]|nr:hypothetical protein [Propionicimonas sp.]